MLRSLTGFIFGVSLGWWTPAYANASAETASASTPLAQLTLTQAEKLFEQNNREILNAKRTVEVANAETEIAGAMPNPVLSVGVANINMNRGVGNANATEGVNHSGLWRQTYATTVQLSQLYERGNKRKLRESVAMRGADATEYDLQETVRRQYLQLATAYYDLKLAQEVVLVQETNIAIYDKTLQATQLRAKVGEVAVSDLSRIRVDALRAKNDLRQAQANLQKAQANLAYLIGKDREAAHIFVVDAWPEFDQHLNLQEEERVLLQRSDVMAANTRITQAQEAQKLAQSLKTRDVTVALAYMHNPGQEPGVYPDTVGATVNVPLFLNYQYQGEAARAEAYYANAVESQSRVMAAALGEVRRAKADLQAAIDKTLRFDREILSEAQKTASSAEFAYKHGASNVIDLLDARRILRAIQLEATNVKADYAKALAAWQAAIKQAEVMDVAQ